MQSNFNRTHRISELIQRELASVIQREFKDPRIGFVTIVGVEVSRDLAHAKIFISIFQEERVEETVKILNEASGFFRTVLSKTMTMRKIPRLHFIFDDSVMRGHRIATLIEKCVNA